MLILPKHEHVCPSRGEGFFFLANYSSLRGSGRGLGYSMRTNILCFAPRPYSCYIPPVHGNIFSRHHLLNSLDFGDLVLEYSDSTSRVSGGDLGSFPRGVTDAGIDEVVFSLEVGETSDVTETKYGFHIFYRYE